MHLALTFFMTSAAIYWLHFLSNHARIAPDSSPMRIWLMSPSSAYPLIPLSLLTMVGVKMHDSLGDHSGFFIGCLCIIGFVHYVSIGVMHSGARVALTNLDPALSWWIDPRGNIHPHLMSGKKNIPAFIPSKAAIRDLITQIEMVGSHVGKPVKIKTPFKLGYLSKQLTKKDWYIGSFSETPCHPALRLILLVERTLLKISMREMLSRIGKGDLISLTKELVSIARSNWQQCATFHHAVLYPPVNVYQPQHDLLRT